MRGAKWGKAVPKMTAATSGIPLAQKPLLRGVSHQIASVVALVASVVLVLRAPSGRPTLAAAVFGLGLVNLFGTSALYHRIDWSPVARQRMRRADHAAIFVLIASGYTPLFLLLPSSSGGHGALAVVWAGAAVGLLKSIAWPHAPKWVMAVLGVGLGWLVIGEVVQRAPLLAWPGLPLIVASGVTYSLGAVVYAVKRPDPFPRVFGYHEVFHALVVLASTLLFVHVGLLLRQDDFAENSFRCQPAVCSGVSVLTTSTFAASAGNVREAGISRAAPEAARGPTSTTTRVPPSSAGRSPGEASCARLASASGCARPATAQRAEVRAGRPVAGSSDCQG
jgi:hemolysin III